MAARTGARVPVTDSETKKAPADDLYVAVDLDDDLDPTELSDTFSG